MELNSLLLENFRNYAAAALTFDAGSNVIFGENAQGKTNLLEAVLFLSRGRSLRARSEGELLRFGEQSGRLLGRIVSRGREFETEIRLESGRRKRMSVNRVPLKRAAGLSEVLHTVYFCPDDLLLIREGAAARRRFLDEALCQLLPRYEEALRRYERLYEHKTRILRDSEEKPALLAALPEFNEGMAQNGALLIHYRARYAAKLAQFAAAAHGECSGGREALSVRYETVSAVLDPFAPPAQLCQWLREHQETHDRAEKAARLCLSGPHKDDLDIRIGGVSARAFGSQGQTRTAALALKLAEREIDREFRGEYPVLLLDDVLSELDPRRQEYVLSRIAGGQVLITCCEDDRLKNLPAGRVFRVENGRVLA